MINGSPHRNGCTTAAFREMQRVFEAEGVTYEVFSLQGKTVQGCIGCGSCGATGRCRFNDAVNEALTLAAESDAVVFGSPVHFASLSGTMTSFLDCLFLAESGRLENKPAACVVSARRAGTTAALDQLLKYPMYAGMPIASGCYWGMVHGMKAEDTAQDLEGMQILRQLARKLVWMVRCIETAEAAGIPRPQREADRIHTSFIR